MGNREWEIGNGRKFCFRIKQIILYQLLIFSFHFGFAPTDKIHDQNQLNLSPC